MNRKTKKLQAPKTATSKRDEGFFHKIAPKSVSRVRQDLASWKAALRQAESADSPKRVMLMRLYNDIMMDALLTSQTEKRLLMTSSASFSLKRDDKVDEESTKILKSASWNNRLRMMILESRFFGHTLVEFITDASGQLKPVMIPRQNVIPQKGLLLYDESSTTGVAYREAKEYNTWLLEFGEDTNLGLLNKAVPHALLKRFAQSCWSELCEIYGIPPRVLKTNTQDKDMLDRADQMMRDMGAAAYFIIDSYEEFEFAQGVNTNGDVYSNLIRLCNNEMSLLISGAIIGQDTKNGNESKEKVSVEQLTNLVEADKAYIESYMNSTVLPALFRIGLLPEGLTWSFDPQEDMAELYKRVIGFMQYLTPDIEWINEKFGMNFTGIKEGGSNFQQASEQ